MATFDETVDNIRSFLSSDTYSKYFKSELFQDFTDSLDMMLTCFDILSKDGQVDTSKLTSVTKLNKTLDYIRIYVLDEVLDNNITTFIESWINLVSNWNDNITKDESLMSTCNLIIRFLQGHFTNLEVLQILKHQNAIARSLRHWLPPAFELSMHYIESLTESDK